MQIQRHKTPWSGDRDGGREESQLERADPEISEVARKKSVGADWEAWDRERLHRVPVRSSRQDSKNLLQMGLASFAQAYILP